MKRYKWFFVRMPGGLNAFVEKAAQSKFSKIKNYSFTVLDSEANRIRIQHSTRAKVVLDLVSPNGTRSKKIFDSVESVELELAEVGSRVLIRIDEPPRSLMKFMNDLEAVVGFGFSAEPYIFQSAAQTDVLRDLDSCKLIGFKGVGSNATAKIVARIEVVSKEGVDPTQLPLLKTLNYKIDHTTYDVSYRMLNGQITFAPSGVVRFSGPLSPHLIGCVEEFLGSATNKFYLDSSTFKK